MAVVVVAVVVVVVVVVVLGVVSLSSLWLLLLITVPQRLMLILSTHQKISKGLGGFKLQIQQTQYI